MRKVVLATVFLASMSGVAAQPASHPSPIDARMWPDVLRALAKDASPDIRSVAGSAGQTLASLGREDLAVYDVPAFIAKKSCTPLLKDDTPVEPVAYIAEAARSAPITMINEGHGEPLTRYFDEQVATALRPLGYGVYAAETFNDETIEAKAPPVPLYSDGYYSREPVYGRLIRKLRTLDFRLVPYEADFDAMRQKYGAQDVEASRRIEQAANLAAQVKQQKSRILVHAGEGNHSEYQAANGRITMGARFTQVTGLDPLTVEAIAYEAPGKTAIICDPEQFAGKPHAFDIHVALPKVTFERGRPTWRAEMGDHYVEIPNSLRRPDQITIYEARPAGEREDSVPMDRLLLRPAENLPLLLPPGRYDVSAWTEKGGWSEPVTIDVR